MPLLLDAILTGKTLRIDGSKSESEVHSLTSELGVNKEAHLLFVPFKAKDSSSEMGILVLSEPSHPFWSEMDESQFSEVANTLTSLLPQPDEKANQGEVKVENQEELQRALEEAEFQRQEYAQLKAKYDDLISKAAGTAIGLGATTAWVEDQKSLQETIRQLEDRNRELEALVAKGRPSIEEVEQLRQELRAALTDLARVPSTLSKSDQKMLELQLSTMKQLDDIGQTELVTSIAQEFRQPLSAIIGYTDLLLGESVGLLGAMQRKFLERVKASTERLGILMQELIQVLVIDGGKVDQTLTMVDLEAVIDEAVGNIIAQISEKNITMRVDLPEKLPEIQVNKEALQQILANLLQNACIVTPDDGEISLYARIERKENEPNLLLISVTDQGGGIANADIPRIFTRRYKVENPLIQGIGDTGVGLSIVKSLVELHKGRVWVDTREGIGSTFSVLIPLVEEQPERVNLPSPE
jgi:signal transduction histidine kinase